MDAEGQYTSARDVATLVRAALGDGNFRVLFTKPSFVTSKTKAHPKGVVLNHTVLSAIAERPEFAGQDFTVLGGKSGTTSDAGLNWVTLATKHGHEYIVVTMGAPVGDVARPLDGNVRDTLRILQEL